MIIDAIAAGDADAAEAAMVKHLRKVERALRVEGVRHAF